MLTPRSLKVLGGTALALAVSCLALPALCGAHGLDALLNFIFHTGWNGDLNSPLLGQFSDATFGSGRDAFIALLRHLGPECGFTVPEPCTTLLTGLFLTMGFVTQKRKGLDTAP